jgi:hypothetical protein
MPVFPLVGAARAARDAISSIVGGSAADLAGSRTAEEFREESAKMAELFPEHRGIVPRAILGFMAAAVASPMTILAELAATTASAETASAASAALVGVAGRTFRRWLVPVLPAVSSWFVVELLCRHGVDIVRTRLLHVPPAAVEARRLYAARRAGRKAEFLRREREILRQAREQFAQTNAKVPGRANPRMPEAMLARQLQSRYRAHGAISSSIATDIDAAGGALPADVLAELRRYRVLRPAPVSLPPALREQLRLPALPLAVASVSPDSGTIQERGTAQRQHQHQHERASSHAATSLYQAPPPPLSTGPNRDSPRLWPARPGSRWDEILEASYEALPAEPSQGEAPASSLASRALAGGLLGGVAGAMMRRGWTADGPGTARGWRSGGPDTGTTVETKAPAAVETKAPATVETKAPATVETKAPALAETNAAARVPPASDALSQQNSARGLLKPALAGQVAASARDSKVASAIRRVPKGSAAAMGLFGAVAGGIIVGACFGMIIPPYEALVRGLRADRDATHAVTAWGEELRSQAKRGKRTDATPTARRVPVVVGSENGKLGGVMPFVVDAQLPPSLRDRFPGP